MSSGVRRTAREERGDLALQRRKVEAVGAHSARGVAWTLGGQWGLQAVRMVSIVVLARLLTPDDYGLMAMAWVITGFVSTVGSLGLSEAVVQRAKVTHAQASTLFWLNIALGAVLMLLVAASAPLLAMFYGRQELVAVTIVLSTTFLLGALTVQHQAVLLRRLQFRTLALRNFAGGVTEIAVSIVAALMGAGYWSLVYGQLAGVVLNVVVLWSAVDWRPGLPRRRSGVRSFVSFGGGISTFRVLDYASRNADNLLIGRFLGGEALGLYTRGYGLLMAPLAQIHGPVANVVRPTMAALWPEPERYRRYYLSALSGLCFVVAPVVVLLAVLADPVVLVLLGPDWSQSADVFRWLSVAGLLQVVGFTNGWLYATSGRSWAMARWALVSRPVLILSFVAGLPWGITGVAMAYALSQLVLTPLGIARAGRGTPVSLRDVLGVAWRPGVVAAGAGLTAAGSWWLVSGSAPFVQLLAGGLPGALVAVLLVLVWPSARREITTLVRSVRKKPAAV
ncbi:lipopolysaccharide biosynthesis protein [Kineococcus sp. SYSU DK004]|uniref:lipopolysaccharide biosynthesis protein n=1 Tax=Kineococcus sp. SYSU DK004 TaxID=3383125 RepID=UPI003D7CC034